MVLEVILVALEVILEVVLEVLEVVRRESFWYIENRFGTSGKPFPIAGYLGLHVQPAEDR